MKPVRLSAGVGVLLLVLAPLSASAQSPADRYFHEAAQHYIADNVPAARQAIEQGLAVAPTDSRLLALRKKLEQSGQAGGGESSQGQRSAGRQQNAQSGGEARSRQSSEEEQESGEGAGAEGQSSDSSRPEQGETRPAFRDGETTDRPSEQQSGGGAAQGASEALTEAQAERLLRALEGQEKRLLQELRTRLSETQSTEKDW